MDRRSFFTRLGQLGAAAVVAPVVLVECLKREPKKLVGRRAQCIIWDDPELGIDMDSAKRNYEQWRRQSRRRLNAEAEASRHTHEQWLKAQDGTPPPVGEHRFFPLRLKDFLKDTA